MHHTGGECVDSYQHEAQQYGFSKYNEVHTEWYRPTEVDCNTQVWTTCPGVWYNNRILAA